MSVCRIHGYLMMAACNEMAFGINVFSTIIKRPELLNWLIRNAGKIGVMTTMGIERGSYCLKSFWHRLICKILLQAPTKFQIPTNKWKTNHLKRWKTQMIESASQELRRIHEKKMDMEREYLNKNVRGRKVKCVDSLPSMVRKMWTKRTSISLSLRHHFCFFLPFWSTNWKIYQCFSLTNPSPVSHFLASFMANERNKSIKLDYILYISASLHCALILNVIGECLAEPAEKKKPTIKCDMDDDDDDDKGSISYVNERARKQASKRASEQK